MLILMFVDSSDIEQMIIIMYIFLSCHKLVTAEVMKALHFL